MKRWYMPSLTFLTLIVIAGLAFLNQGSQMTLAASPASLAFIYHSDWWNATQFSADAARYRTVAGDFNGDGWDDIAMLFRRTFPILDTRIYWMLGAGDHFDWQGQNSIGWHIDADKFTGAVVAGDFNAGGYDDVAGIRDGAVILWASDGSDFPDFTSMAVLPGGLESNFYDRVAGRVVAGDFDGDGVNDDIAALYDVDGGQNARIYALISNGDAFQRRLWWSNVGTNIDFDAGRTTYRIVAGDFNQDGRDDVAAVYDEGSNGARVPVWLSSSFDPTGVSFGSFSYHPSWWSETTYDAGSVTGRVAAGDFDGDGDDDISLLHEDPADANHIRAHILLSTRQDFAFQGNDPGWWDHYSYIPSYATGRVVPGDWNGDGVDDLGVIYGSSTFARAQVLESTALPPGPATTRQVDSDNTACDDSTGTPYCSIQAAVDAANDGDTITLTAGTYSEHVILPRYGVDGFNQSLTVQGTGPANTIVDGGASGTVFTVHRGGQITLSGLAIRNGSTDGDGGGVYNGGDMLAVANSTLNGNTAGERGGAIYSASLSELTVSNSTFSGNSAGTGGGIWTGTSLTTINHSTFSDNSAVPGSLFGYGGAIRFGGTMEVVGSTLSGNSAEFGGGIMGTGTLTVTGSTFRGNTARRGGGIDAGGILAIGRSVFSDNAATQYWGGGIYTDATIKVDGSTLSGNTAVLDGGGLWTDGELTVSNSTFSGNTAGDHGGGLYKEESDVMAISNSTFTTNSAGYSGGGIYTAVGTTTVLTNTIVANNTGGDCAGPGNWDAMGSPNLDSDGGCPFTLTGSPLLGPLQDNGGPTPTHALLEGSPAIDAGSNIDCLATDQRGLPRPQDGDDDGIALCDIGAFELGSWRLYIPMVIRP